MTTCERIKEILVDELRVNRIIRNIITGEFGIEMTLDQVETCFMMAIEKYFDYVTVSVPVAAHYFNLYLDAKKYMNEHYYVLANRVVGTESYLTERLERDIKDVWAMSIELVKEVDFQMDQIICISKDVDFLKQLASDVRQQEVMDPYFDTY